MRQCLEQLAEVEGGRRVTLGARSPLVGEPSTGVGHEWFLSALYCPCAAGAVLAQRGLHAGGAANTPRQREAALHAAGRLLQGLRAATLLGGVGEKDWRQRHCPIE